MMLENALEEISTEVRLAKPTLFRYRKVGPPFPEDPDEYAGTIFGARAVRSEHLDSLHTAARRAAFEDETVKARLLELGEPLPGEDLHPFRQILARVRLDQPRCGLTFQEPDRRPRHTEPDLDLRAHWHPYEELTEHLGDISLPLVAAVVSDRGAKQARRDAEADGIVVVPEAPG